MSDEEVKQQLLFSSEKSYEDDDLESYQEKHSEPVQNHSTKKRCTFLASTLLLSLVCNIFLLAAYFKARSQIHLCPSEYSEQYHDHIRSYERKLISF